MILVDERRLAHGIEPALIARTGDADAIASPASFLEDLLALRTVGEGERRALVRRIAATRGDLGIPEHVRRSPSFAARVIAAIDRGADEPFGKLIDEYRTLLAFAGAVDVTEALRRALAGGERGGSVQLARIEIDTLLLDEPSGAFAWRRLGALAEIALDPVALEPIQPGAVDVVAVAGVVAFLRYAGSESDADARAALRSKLAPIDPDDARMLLAIAADRSDVLNVIETGAAGGGREFAHALRTIGRAYRIPDAGAADVVAAIARELGLDPRTHAALNRIARDFDRARIVAPAWEAADLCDEIAAELAGTGTVAPDFAADPAPLIAPEAAVPVTTRRATFSASSLNAFAECERKWYYRYVCAAVEDRGSSASFYGIAFHAALEDFHRTHARFDGIDAAPVGAFLDYCMVAAFDRHRTRFDAPIEFELQKRRARRTAKRYLAWLLERAARAPFEVIGTETSTEVRLGEFPFIGFIDRLDRDLATGAVTVVDYKTGSIAKSAAEYLADVLAFREFQLPFYYWARTLAGDRVTRLALVPLKDALLDVAPIELTVVDGPRAARPNGRRDATAGTIAIADLDRARDRMIELAGRLSTASIANYPATDDPAACRYCAYQDACRDRPAVVEERFGR
jgi:RecB family exonuclease